MNKLRVLDLFSGIGGFSLGLERTGGFQTVAFCEIEPWCRKVLARHWPHVRCYQDVRTLSADTLFRDGIAIDAICGGFPCQDISFAGKGAGIAGERSGLWGEYARLIGEIRPRYAIIENVSALLVRGIERVLWDLAALGYDAEWHCIPAAAVGAPHRRDRIWIVVYPTPQRCNGVLDNRITSTTLFGSTGGSGSARDVPDADRNSQHAVTLHAEMAFASQSVSNASGADVEGQWLASGISAQRDTTGGAGWWRTEPDVGRVAHGVPNRVDRLRGLGNAVVPQIPELIGRAILAARAAA